MFNIINSRSISMKLIFPVHLVIITSQLTTIAFVGDDVTRSTTLAGFPCLDTLTFQLTNVRGWLVKRSACYVVVCRLIVLTIRKHERVCCTPSQSVRGSSMALIFLPQSLYHRSVDDYQLAHIRPSSQNRDFSFYCP